MILTRRSFLTGLLAAPIIVRPGILMPIRPLQFETIHLLPPGDYFGEIVKVEISPTGVMALTTRVKTMFENARGQERRYPSALEMDAEMAGVTVQELIARRSHTS